MVSPLLAQEVVTVTDVIPGGTGGLAADGFGNVFIGDWGETLDGPPGTRVFKVDDAGNVSVFASGLNGASGNDFDAAGNLYQSNFVAGRIDKITPDGTRTTFATGLVGPVGIAVDDNGDLFVCNCSQNNIAKVTSSGQVSIFATSGLFNCPNGITFDDEGNLFVSNFGGGFVTKILPDASVQFWANVPGGNNGHLSYFQGDLYVAGRGANRIYKIDPDRVVSVFAGNGTRAVVDGPLLEAGFSLPNDVIIDPTGRYMYVNDVLDAANSRDTAPMVLRRIDLGDPAGVGDMQEAADKSYAVSISPNPFQQSTTVTFRLPQEANVAVEVYDTNGRRIRELWRGRSRPGRHQVRWDGNDETGHSVPSGVYLYRIEADGKVESGRIQLVR